MKILVTGSNGFIGQALCKKLLASGYSVNATLRQSGTRSQLHKNCSYIADNASAHSNTNFIVVGDISREADWSRALQEVDVVIHLAAHVHNTGKLISKSLVDVCKVNVAGTERLARDAVKVGVKRFIYMSSIKVNGEFTHKNSRFTENDPPRPQGTYALSKYKAEQTLHSIARETGLEVVILRPPLVYGPGVKANFLTLIKVVSWRIPLPLATIRNRRSLLYLGNLVDVIATCITHPKAAGQTFMVSDGEDISTPELINHIAANLQRPSYLFSLPKTVLNLLGKLPRRNSAISRITDSLVIDSFKLRQELGWSPPHTIIEGLRLTTDWYEGRKKHNLC